MVRSIKNKIAAMLEERQALSAQNSADCTPSSYWSDFCSYFDYMLGLPEDAFAKLRVHTYHLTGDIYQTYYFGNPQALKGYWEDLIEGMPSRYILSEPAGGIGFVYDGRLVSHDILRYQRAINTLYQHHILAQLSTDRGRRPYILEIGGGYGAMAHHLSKVGCKATYIIVDLPETLLFAAPYLYLHNPDKRMYIYEHSTFKELIHSNAMSEFDFVLLPNYALDALRQLKFDLVVNIAAFQEMRASQVAAYLDFINETCTGVLYSWNQDAQPRNRELANLSQMLRARFDIMPVTSRQRARMQRRLKVGFREASRLLARVTGVIQQRPYREYICRPRLRESMRPQQA